MVAVMFATARTIRVVPRAATKAINRDKIAREAYILFRPNNVPGLFFWVRFFDDRICTLPEELL
jgi:hypothetical protein